MADLLSKGHQGLNLLSAVEAANKIANGEITAKSLVEDCLQRIEERDPTIGAWQHLDRGHTLVQAQEVDEGIRTGPLAGVPIGIKDNFDTRDMPTGYGTSISVSYTHLTLPTKA